MAPWPEGLAPHRSWSGKCSGAPFNKSRAWGARGGNGELTPRQNRMQGQLGDVLHRDLADPGSLRGSAVK